MPELAVSEPRALIYLDKNGQMPLRWALKYGDEAVARLLLEIGKAQVN